MPKDRLSLQLRVAMGERVIRKFNAYVIIALFMMALGAAVYAVLSVVMKWIFIGACLGLMGAAVIYILFWKKNERFP